MFDHLAGLALKDAAIKAAKIANTDTASVMWQTMQRTPHLGSNGGTAAGLVGSHDEVAARILAFHKAGIELFMLQFQPLEAEAGPVRAGGHAARAQARRRRRMSRGRSRAGCALSGWMVLTSTSSGP